MIVSDDAGQFNVGQHGLCWVHSERLVHKLDTFTDENRAAQSTVRELIWQFYRDLKAYRGAPTKRRKAALRARFDRIFTRKTGFVTLDRLLARLHANEPELLMVLNRPEIPLHTNGSENDVRCHVTRRKVSGGTRSDVGRDCRDTFLGLAKTSRQAQNRVLGLPRLKTGCPRQPGHPIPAGIGRHPPTADGREFCPITHPRNRGKTRGRQGGRGWVGVSQFRQVWDGRAAGTGRYYDGPQSEANAFVAMWQQRVPQPPAPQRARLATPARPDRLSCRRKVLLARAGVQ